MPLTRGRFLGYEFDRMVMLFSMVDGQREIPCAISTSAIAIGLKSVPLANSWLWSSKALLQALFCAVSTSRHSRGRSQQA